MSLTSWKRLFVAGLPFLVASEITAVVVPFDPGRGLVEVEVVIDGRVKGRFGIDTGADRLYIDSTFARKHNLSFLRWTPERPVVGIDGSSQSGMVDVRSLRIGDETLYNLRATSINIGNIVKDTRLGYPDGLIGHEILRRFYITVDYPHRTLELRMELPDFLKDTSLPSLDFTTYRHLIIVEVTINDTVNVPMALDYCASYTSLSQQLAKRLQLDTGENNRGTLPSMVLGGVVRSGDVPVVITDLTQFKKSLRGETFEGIIGASFLYRHKLTIDYKQKRIYVHY
jgi:predicted aspartyl protease